MKRIVLKKPDEYLTRKVPTHRVQTFSRERPREARLSEAMVSQSRLVARACLNAELDPAVSARSASLLFNEKSWRTAMLGNSELCLEPRRHRTPGDDRRVIGLAALLAEQVIARHHERKAAEEIA